MSQNHTAPPQRTGADLLCETLLSEGVDLCLSNPGTSEMHFVAALDRQPRMRCVLGLFEGVVTGAADGYARMADKPACTLLHTGPGLANGLANLHNARRAHTPIVNVVGDHATWHLDADAPLTSDIDSLARPMSRWVGRSTSPDALGELAQQAVLESLQPPGGVATLVLPADHAWSPTQQRPPAPRVRTQPRAPAVQTETSTHLAVLAALKKGKSTCLLLAGQTLRDEGLLLAARIAHTTGVQLLTQQANGRVQRGLGRLMLDRVPYVVDKALAQLQRLQCMVLLGAKAPVGFFGYPGKPSSMLPPACSVLVAAHTGEDELQALRWLAEAVGAKHSPEPAALLARRQPLPLPVGVLTADAVNRSVVAQLPEQAIVCDESVSSGREFFAMSWHAAPHDYLQITGGAIGCGLPLATGAALAAPGRKVVTLQADGSAMYSLQALWTQAREQLDVLTIIYSNRTYAILHGEYRAVGAGAAGANARRMFDFDSPPLNWVQLAQGQGVEAARADSAKTFNDLMAAALGKRGPFLIEAVIEG